MEVGNLNISKPQALVTKTKGVVNAGGGGEMLRPESCKGHKMQTYIQVYNRDGEFWET